MISQLTRQNEVDFENRRRVNRYTSSSILLFWRVPIPHYAETSLDILLGIGTTFVVVFNWCPVVRCYLVRKETVGLGSSFDVGSESWSAVATRDFCISEMGGAVRKTIFDYSSLSDTIRDSDKWWKKYKFNATKKLTREVVYSQQGRLIGMFLVGSNSSASVSKKAALLYFLSGQYSMCWRYRQGLAYLWQSKLHPSLSVEEHSGTSTAPSAERAHESLRVYLSDLLYLEIAEYEIKIRDGNEGRRLRENRWLMKMQLGGKALLSGSGKDGGVYKMETFGDGEEASNDWEYSKKKLGDGGGVPRNNTSPPKSWFNWPMLACFFSGRTHWKWEWEWDTQVGCTIIGDFNRDLETMTIHRDTPSPCLVRSECNGVRLQTSKRAGKGVARKIGPNGKWASGSSRYFLHLSGCLEELDARCWTGLLGKIEERPMKNPCSSLLAEAPLVVPGLVSRQPSARSDLSSGGLGAVKGSQLTLVRKSNGYCERSCYRRMINKSQDGFGVAVELGYSDVSNGTDLGAMNNDTNAQMKERSEEKDDDGLSQTRHGSRRWASPHQLMPAKGTLRGKDAEEEKMRGKEGINVKVTKNNVPRREEGGGREKVKGVHLAELFTWDLVSRSYPTLPLCNRSMSVLAITHAYQKDGERDTGRQYPDASTHPLELWSNGARPITLRTYLYTYHSRGKDRKVEREGAFRWTAARRPAGRISLEGKYLKARMAEVGDTWPVLETGAVDRYRTMVLSVRSTLGATWYGRAGQGWAGKKKAGTSFLESSRGWNGKQSNRPHWERWSCNLPSFFCLSPHLKAAYLLHVGLALRKYRHTCWTVSRYTTMRRMSCLCLSNASCLRGKVGRYIGGLNFSPWLYLSEWGRINR
ncbi:hypothetical protein CCUS01_06288 [Colletotrichum cuscutae]|uniref:Uncharacterized protein n=1 Tax=Colletotrichum cuscutae TaxID=1209917 RepID=A0AAI9V4B6_9PEZI|nr:hypothetical protein CCUS01_06288 [Colletotrichum cuscutae]